MRTALNIPCDIRAAPIEYKHAYARRRVDVTLGAFDVTVCDASTGEVVATYEREWGEAPTDSSDPTLRPGLPCARPAGWRDSSVRASLPAELVSFLDSERPAGLAADLRVLRDESAERGWPAAVEGMSRSLAATGGVDRASVALSAASTTRRSTWASTTGRRGCSREAIAVPQTSSERGAAQASFRDAARALFISGDTIAAFLASATPGQVAACTSMLESEIAHRDGTRRARLPGQARFPVPKSVEGFDWSNVSFPDGWGREDMCSLAFVRDAEDLVFYGQTGRGKTHMATALGIAATSAGYPAGFWQTARLVPRLGKAKREGTLDRLLADVAKARLLVLDEFGYVPFDVDGARLPCQVISESYGRRSVISATNVESGRWGTVFADDKLAAAIVDRVVHHGRLVEFGGPSHRLEESLMLGKDDVQFLSHF